MFFLRAVFRFLFIACIQIVRSKMTSLDAIFCSGNKSSSRSLARFCRRKQQKNLPLALRAREKIWPRLVGKSNCLYFTYLHALNYVRTYMKTTRQWRSNFKIYKDLYAKPLNPDWVARVVFSCTNPSNLSAAVAIASFQIYGWNVTGYPILIRAFRFHN